MDFAPDHRALEDLERELADRGIEYVQVETPDLNGTLRGKLTRRSKALGPGGSAFCTIVYGLSAADDVYESPFSSFSNGFPDAFAIADPNTGAIIDKERGIASVICDMVDETGLQYYPLSPRTALRRVIKTASDLGFTARFAVELEVFVVKADRDMIDAGKIHDLSSFGRLHNAYSLARMDELRPLAARFMDQMDELKIGIEAIHTELGNGMIEVAIGHLPALQAADACSRVKLYLKEMFAAEGYLTVFMPKWRIEESGCGGHTHQSLWRGDEPAFAGAGGEFSDIGEQYVAGQLTTLRDFCAVFYPTINAYRRMDAMSWAPENVSWGMDNRTCALRVITKPGPKAYRIEHRCPGADINGYLSIACMLGGGLLGIAEKMDPGPAVTGNSLDHPALPALPKNLEEAVEMFRNSDKAKAILGEEFVEQYTISREDECRLWNEWNQKNITGWELGRYIDMH